ncbi:hypothetical protein [Mycobacterium montefiorense]|uniref:hypothetical protein n=1 Tax=Mycobacterium montefiorense TaxID=154654 RepID=UPI0021F3C802|nr:hypothetical protein [Mycobacterium montefiorense]MCV7428054.1 hypothetical protein [Mycobacterium montefiorense]
MSISVITYSALSDKCVSQQHPWSVIDVSTPNAQLAGVLAGFMLLAITTLLTMKRADLEAAENAVVYLGLGVIVLGLDSYLFGSIAAIKPDEHSDYQQVCKRAWLDFMPAAGLLGVGAVLLVAGLAWVIARHDWGGDSAEFTTRASYAALVVILGPLTLLAYNAINFIDEMRGELDEICTEAQGFGVAIVCICFIVCTAMVLRTLIRVASGRRGVVDSKRTRFWVSTPCIVYLLVALGFTVLYPWLPDSHSIFYFAIGIVLCMVVPSIIFVSIAFAMPGSYVPSQQANGEPPDLPASNPPPKGE